MGQFNIAPTFATIPAEIRAMIFHYVLVEPNLPMIKYSRFNTQYRGIIGGVLDTRSYGPHIANVSLGEVITI